MTKQEEIEEGITWIIFNRFAKTLEYWPPRFRQLTSKCGAGRLPEEFYKLTDKILSYLHSQGVVIKVDRDMEFLDDIGVYPQSVVGGENDYEERSPYQNGWNAAVLEITKQWAKEAKDFKAVEPLIKETLPSIDYGRRGSCTGCANEPLIKENKVT